MFNDVLQLRSEAIKMKDKLTVSKLFGEEPITVQIIEDGILEHCNHAGAEYKEVLREVFQFDPREGNYFPVDESKWMMICDKENCNAVSDDGENWNE